MSPRPLPPVLASVRTPIGTRSDAKTVLVRGGTVVDGTGAPGVHADVRVRDGLIVEVGASLAVDGDTELDADGAVVTPGFIDNHTHFDPSLFWDPFCDPMPQHGVTSVLIGNCSLSLAPMRAELQDGLSSVFSYIEDIPLPAFLDDVPWGWESYAEYRDATARGGLGVNVACLVGHTPLRLCVMGDAAWNAPRPRMSARRSRRCSATPSVRALSGCRRRSSTRTPRAVPCRHASPTTTSSAHCSTC